VDIILIGIIAVFLGGFLQGCLGFGFGMIVVPTLLMVLTASEVIPMCIGISLLLCIPLAWHARHHFNAALVIPLLIGALFGLPVGMKTLALFDGPYLKMFVGLLLVGMSLAMFNGWSRPIKNQTLALFPIGFLSGMMQTTLAMSGPPIILFLTNQSMDKDRFRANLLIYFAVIGAVSVTSYTLQGVYTQPMLERMIILVSAVLIGGLLGVKMAEKIPQELFRKITLVVSGVMGLVLFTKNIAVLLG
jgi:uncharacterized protein